MLLGLTSPYSWADKLFYGEKEWEKRHLKREKNIFCALGFRHLRWKCCLSSSLAGPWGSGGQKSRWREGRVASLDRYRKAQWALSLSRSLSLSLSCCCSPSHPHFSCCLDKSASAAQQRFCVESPLVNNLTVSERTHMLCLFVKNTCFRWYMHTLQLLLFISISCFVPLTVVFQRFFWLFCFFKRKWKGRNRGQLCVKSFSALHPIFVSPFGRRKHRNTVYSQHHYVTQR